MLTMHLTCYFFLPVVFFSFILPAFSTVIGCRFDCLAWSKHSYKYGYEYFQNSVTMTSSLWLNQTASFLVMSSAVLAQCTTISTHPPKFRRMHASFLCFILRFTLPHHPSLRFLLCHRPGEKEVVSPAEVSPTLGWED